jgi:hypothetical protein
LNSSRINDNRPLAILALVHLCCGPCLGFFAFLEGPEIADSTYEGLFFGQIGLLGIWGGLATYRRSIRLVGVAIGLAYLTAQYRFFCVNDWELLTLFFVFLPTVTVVGVMLVIRRFVAKLERPATATISRPAEGTQFSIRQMMLFTLVVGCFLGIVRWLQPHVRPLENPTLFATVLLGCASIAVVAVWATLGQAPPIRRGCAVSLQGLLIGWISYLTASDGELWFWIVVMVVEATVLQASLLVVRQCGFRLVRVRAFR